MLINEVEIYKIGNCSMKFRINLAMTTIRGKYKLYFNKFKELYFEKYIGKI